MINDVQLFSDTFNTFCSIHHKKMSKILIYGNSCYHKKYWTFLKSTFLFKNVQFLKMSKKKCPFS